MWGKLIGLSPYVAVGASTVLIGGSGGGYFLYNRHQRQKIFDYQRRYVDDEEFTTIQRTFETNQTTLELTSTKLKDNEQEQEKILAQMTPLQKNLMALKTDYKEGKTVISNIVQRNQQLESDLHNAQNQEKLWFEDYKHQIDQISQQKLVNLNNEAMGKYRQECLNNEELIKKETQEKIDKVKLQQLGRADQLLKQMQPSN